MAVVMAGAAAWYSWRAPRVMMPTLRLVDAGAKAGVAAARGTGVPRAQIGDDHRYVLSTRVEQGVAVHRTADVAIPQGAVLAFALGTERTTSAGTVTFAIDACSGDVCEPVFVEAVEVGPATPSEWRDRRVSLAHLGALRRVLVFHATPSPADLRPLWANPTLLAPGRRRDHERNVVLISLDTLRADHLGSYGYGRATSPFIDETFARGGTVFERCVAASTTTPPSHMTMLTSVPPLVHRVGVRGIQGLPTWLATAPELLRAAGYATGAVTEDGWVSYSQGFGRGFDSYTENKSPDLMAPLGQADLTFRNASAWLREHRDERFFLFVHTYQVHAPYAPPPEYAALFADQIPADAPPAVRDAANYDREIRFTDDQLRGFVATLRELALDRRTVVMIVSDHGEEFVEHGCTEHGGQLYDEVARVPLLLWGAGVPAGKRIATPVAHLDVMPTILDLAGLPRPDQTMGTSLVPWMTGTPPAEARQLFGEAWVDARCAGGAGEPRIYEAPGLIVQSGTLKLHRYRRNGTVREELYDVATDPTERTDLSGAGEAAAVPLRAALDDYERACAARARALAAGASTGSGTAAAPTLDERQREKLRALGYVD